MSGGSRARWVGACLAIASAACGRFHFDDAAALGAGDVDAARDGTRTPDSFVATCAMTCGPDQYCGTAPGSCTSTATCLTRPLSCAQVDLPVCGCDHVTYANECAANQAGASMETLGACTPMGTYVPPCNPPCSGSEYCATSACQGPGTCMPRPPITQMCTDVPVCGCDGISYGTACDAHRAGVDVANLGTCAN